MREEARSPRATSGRIPSGLRRSPTAEPPDHTSPPRTGMSPTTCRISRPKAIRPMTALVWLASRPGFCFPARRRQRLARHTESARKASTPATPAPTPTNTSRTPSTSTKTPRNQRQRPDADGETDAARFAQRRPEKSGKRPVSRNSDQQRRCVTEDCVNRLRAADRPGPAEPPE